MIPAAVLSTYAAAAGWLAPAALRGVWTARSPRLALSLWLALPLSWVVAVILATLSATVPAAFTWHAPQPAGSRALLAGPSVPGGQVIAIAGLLAIAAILSWVCWFLIAELMRDRRARHDHAAVLAGAAQLRDEPDVVVLDQDLPAAYSLPASRHLIVVSAGTLLALEPGQLQAVLAHEQAHLRNRHHLMLTVAAALAAAFPLVPLLAKASEHIGTLAELAADDAAARRYSRDDLAAALVILARAGASRATLAAGGPATIARIRRLLAPQRGPARAARLAAGAGLLLPVAIACLPLVIAACGVTSRI